MGDFTSGLVQGEILRAQVEAQYLRKGGKAGLNLMQRMDGRLAAARALLGISGAYTAAEIKTAFRNKAKIGHVDAGGSGGDMAALVEARDLLLTTVVESPSETTTGKEEKTCQLCSGTGMVASGFGATECASCRGTGIVA